MDVVLIAAVAKNGVIGREGTLPWRLPDDLAHFKQLTLGKPIVMGRKTYESIGRPLPKRTNIVLSRSAAPIDGAIVVRSIEDAITAARETEVSELCVIGGEAVYAAFLPRADRLELTEVDAEVEGDARFPDFDRAAWRVVCEAFHEADARHEHAFRFVTYVRS
ncbi:MAG: type 3 dihydrofolate reductase [Myxococcota bacterium]|nr:type 3 dihydrofolate reductase [Myxococcota bacterium]